MSDEDDPYVELANLFMEMASSKGRYQVFCEAGGNMTEAIEEKAKPETPEEVSKEMRQAAEAVFVLQRFFERQTTASERASLIALSINDRAKVLDFYALVIQANATHFTNKEARRLARNAFESIAKHEAERFAQMLVQLQQQVSPVAVATPKIEVVQ